MPFVNGVWQEWQNATNVTNFVGAMQYVNGVTNYMFGYMALLAVFTIILMAGRGSLQSVASGLFITTIIGYLLAGLGLVGSEAIVPLTIALVVAIILMYKEGGTNGV